MVESIPSCAAHCARTTLNAQAAARKPPSAAPRFAQYDPHAHPHAQRSPSAHAAVRSRAASKLERHLRRRLQRVTIDAIVASVFDAERRVLHTNERGGAYVARARQVGMYLAHIALGLSYSDTARLYGRHRTTASHACAIIEDMRDDATFDRVVAELERATRAHLRHARRPLAEPAVTASGHVS